MKRIFVKVLILIRSKQKYIPKAKVISINFAKSSEKGCRCALSSPLIDGNITQPETCADNMIEQSFNTNVKNNN